MSTEITRVHDRLDDVFHELAEHRAVLSSMNQTIVASTAQCRLCQPIIFGNGKPAIDIRVDRIEQVEKTRQRWFWVIVGVVPAITGTAAAIIIHFL